MISTKAVLIHASFSDLDMFQYFSSEGQERADLNFICSQILIIAIRDFLLEHQAHYLVFKRGLGRNPNIPCIFNQKSFNV